MIHCCVCSIILVHLCSRSVVCTVCAVVVGTRVSQVRDVLGISTETTASLQQARQEHFFVYLFTSSACKQRINIFCQPCFGMVGLVHSQTESLRRARSCLPVISILVKKMLCCPSINIPRQTAIPCITTNILPTHFLIRSL